MSESEQSFLNTYNAADYPIVLLSVDAVLLTYHEDRLKVLLVERASHPAIGCWALPGGFIDQRADNQLEDAAMRSLKNKTGVAPPYIEQLGAFGSADRDPRGWSTTVAYTALIPYAACAAHIDSVSDSQWFDVDRLKTLKLAFDHQRIIEAGIERFRQKALYSLVTARALAEPFTLYELRRVHELLIGKTIQRKSFLRRIESSGVLKETGETKVIDKGRPAMLYKTRPGIDDYRFVRNIDG
ncbi:NUDIX hydrolase [Saccharospirillum sp. MSK14-1]|uniref:NUDIX hydrolase n=1 Tax=Saccharospirillum sp. MSK14-1 TaxID=1897632 RepID=UPI000D357C33|nr:NUDIX domain-containing protein [Saccharospirillum sp. MSK14-1]PTY38255.1 NUDIX hydrolase [Saccharospirillum sp. MSK14-1]